MARRFQFLNISFGDVDQNTCWMLSHETDCIYQSIRAWYEELEELDCEMIKDKWRYFLYLDTDTTGYCKIEIPHGHASDLYWFLEHELRKMICDLATDALCFDEGVGWLDRDTVSYNNTMEYLKSMYDKSKISIIYRVAWMLELVDNNIFGPEFYPALGIESPDKLREQYKDDLLEFERICSSINIQ